MRRYSLALVALLSLGCRPASETIALHAEASWNWAEGEAAGDVNPWREKLPLVGGSASAPLAAAGETTDGDAATATRSAPVAADVARADAGELDAPEVIEIYTANESAIAAIWEANPDYTMRDAVAAWQAAQK